MIAYRFNQGGLMRCCLQTLDEHMAAANEPPREGEPLSCRFHEEQPNVEMIFTDGAWRWNREKHFGTDDTSLARADRRAGGGDAT